MCAGSIPDEYTVNINTTIPSAPTCVYAAECQVDDDCASGECGVAAYNDGCFEYIALGCRNEDDACRTHGDCESSPDGHSCVFGDPNYGTEGWTCAAESCAIGRPLLVDGRARVAATRVRSGWEAPHRDRNALGLDIRERLAAHFAAVGSFEHASVASFARFVQQLLALGAPAELVAETLRAAQDEVRHARLAYALASAHAGVDLGPGPLDVRGAVVASVDRCEVVEGLIREACIGETLGVAEARFGLERSSDPDAHAFLEQVVSDETRHAALGWRSLQWLLATGDQALREHARVVFADALAEARQGVRRLEGGTDRGDPSLGRLGSRDLAVAHRAALSEVIEPTAHALLSSLCMPARARA